MEEKNKGVFHFNLIKSKMNCAAKPTNIVPFQRVKNYEVVDATVEDFCRYCVNGYAWRAGIYDAGCTSFKKPNVKGSRILALDFDSCEHSPHDVIEMAAKRNILPSFFYYSFSQDILRVKNEENSHCSKYIIRTVKNHLKNETVISPSAKFKKGFNFRVVWVLDEVIDKKDYEAIIKIFINNTFKMFNPDQATKDVSRLWYGGATEGAVVRDEAVPLMDVVRVYAEDKLDSGVRPDNLKRDKLVQDLIASNPAPETAVVVPNNWEEYLSAHCPLWRKWKAQEYIEYYDRRNLWANLAFIKYKNPNKHIINDVLSYYKPQNWIGHSNIQAEIFYKMNKLDDWNPQGVITGKYGSELTVPEYFSNLDISVNGEYLKPALKKTTLKELDEWLDEQVPNALGSAEMVYLNSQTGSGKTERVIDYVLDCAASDKKIIYAVPQYETAKEFVERLKQKQGFANFETYCLTRNDYTDAGLARLALGLSSGDAINPERKEVIGKLMDEQEKGLFVITHALLANLEDITADLIIVDENIEEALAPQKVLTIDQLRTVERYLPNSHKYKYASWVSSIADMERGQEPDLNVFRDVMIKFIDSVDAYLADYANSPFAANGIFTLAGAGVRVRTTRVGEIPALVFVKLSSVIQDAIERNIPIKLLTATPMNALLEVMYNVSPHIIEAPRAQNEGSVIQFRNTTGARGKNNEKVEELIATAKQTLSKDILDKDPIFISFKGTAESLEKEALNCATLSDGTQLHFGNNRGLDLLKGQTVVVLGKPDKNQEYYLQLWDLIGDGEPLTLSSQNITVNGIRQKLFLFNNEKVRKIQLQNLEYSLAQTVGRARALREVGAEVYIFANYVCGDVDRVYF